MHFAIPFAVAAVIIGIVLGFGAPAPVSEDPAPARYSATQWSVAHAAILDDRDDPAEPEISSTF
jgi:hypothetical protein